MTLTELLSVADVARITGLSDYTVRQAIRDGDLPASKLRGRIRIHPDDLAGWIDDSRVRPTDTAPVVPRHRPAPRTPAPAGGYRRAARRAA